MRVVSITHQGLRSAIADTPFPRMSKDAFTQGVYIEMENPHAKGGKIALYISPNEIIDILSKTLSMEDYIKACNGNGAEAGALILKVDNMVRRAG